MLNSHCVYSFVLCSLFSRETYEKYVCRINCFVSDLGPMYFIALKRSGSQTFHALNIFSDIGSMALLKINR